MPMIDVTVHYLEMRTHIQNTMSPPRSGVTVQQLVRPAVPTYRSIYNAVGEDYNWRLRRRMSDDELAAIIHDTREEVHVLQVDGTPAGFAELDRRAMPDIELVQFGLMPEFIGQGLGKWFLQWTVNKAWSYQPERFWLHTCSLDHKAALPNYLQAGFVEYQTEIVKREYPPPPT